MKRPHNHTTAGLLRLLADPETAVQVVSYTAPDGTEGDSFGPMRPGVDYWPRRDLPTGHRKNQRIAPDERIRFVNTTGTIALMWYGSWTYQSDDDGNAVIATRQSRPDGARLVIRLHQPNVLAAAWSASLDPDRIEDE